MPARPDLAPIVDGRRRQFCCHSAAYSGRHPANSLAAVSECVAAGVPRLEIDLHVIDSRLMAVNHDADVDGRPLAGHFEQMGAAAGIPILEEVLEIVRPGSTFLQVDLKTEHILDGAELDALVPPLRRLPAGVIVGSMAHWNLRRLAEAGLPVAFDPFEHLHWWPGREGVHLPRRQGAHGFWDDSPLAVAARLDASAYLASRLEDLAGLVLPARELMIEYHTVLAMAERTDLPAVLAGLDIELTAWTVPDDGPERTSGILRSLFDAGATTIITDFPLELARYAHNLA